MKIEGVFAIVRIILLFVAIVLITLIIFHQTKEERYVTNKDSLLEIMVSHNSISMPVSNDGSIASGIILFLILVDEIRSQEYSDVVLEVACACR